MEGDEFFIEVNGIFCTQRGYNDSLVGNGIDPEILNRIGIEL